MFTDTHCHLLTMEKAGIKIDDFFKDFSKEKDAYLVDIGTHPDDLNNRLQFSETVKKYSPDFNYLYFSAGIWPDDEYISNPAQSVEALKDCIKPVLEQKNTHLCAIGECGLDRHYNTAEKGAAFLHREDELFAAQIELAKQLGLPLIVHSRDDFDATYRILKNADYSQTVIHCFSYGIKEAGAFLDAGCYISLCGSITFGGKSRQEESRKLINYIPRDRLFLETDSPYMAPVPCRGQTNTPLLISHTYDFVASAMNITPQELNIAVTANAKDFFSFNTPNA